MQEEINKSNVTKRRKNQTTTFIIFRITFFLVILICVTEQRESCNKNIKQQTTTTITTNNGSSNNGNMRKTFRLFFKEVTNTYKARFTVQRSNVPVLLRATIKRTTDEIIFLCLK